MQRYLNKRTQLLEGYTDIAAVTAQVLVLMLCYANIPPCCS
jgi:hypothetical protein